VTDAAIIDDGAVTPTGGRMPARRAMPLLGGVPVALWQLAFFVLPLVFLVVITFWKVKSFKLQPAFDFGNWEKVLTSTPFQRALTYTFEVAAITTVLAMLVAFPAAHAIALRLSEKARARWIAFLIIPIFSSYILKVYAWQVVLSPSGIVNVVFQWLGLPAADLLGGAFSLYVGLLTLTLPVVTLILVFSMSGLDRNQLEAARNLGASGFQVLTQVTLPAIKSGLGLAGVTAFLMSFGDYASPVFLTGSNPPTLSILIVDTVKSGSQWPRASVVGVSMLAILTLAFVLVQVVTRKRKIGGV
jgi:spermidine/putrescine transport system permease protein/putrescine transport system permease protein